MNDTLHDSVGLVLEGFTLPPEVRKILETAYYASPARDTNASIPQPNREIAYSAWATLCDIGYVWDAKQRRWVDHHGKCIGIGGKEGGCGYHGGKSGDVCPKCGGMLLSDESAKLAKQVKNNL